MSRSSSRRFARGSRRAAWAGAGPPLVAALFALAFQTGCDNVACVFGPGNCSEGGSGSTPGVGSYPATLPVNGEWIGPAAPTITAFLPTGESVVTTSPIVMTFSESLAPANLTTAFELQLGDTNPVSLNNVVLIGDGRVAVAMPIAPLLPGAIYTVLYRTTALLTDRVGRPVVQPSDRIIGTFTTNATDPDVPAVLTSWPASGATDQSTTTEAIIVFDRAIDDGSISSSSFVVTVAGAAPAFNPAPTPVQGPAGLGPDTRVYRWRSVDNNQVPVSLGLNKLIKFDLSPAGHAISDTAQQDLPHTTLSFTTASFSAPTSASITSMPSDAIGINEISGPADLAVKVNFAGAQTGDFVGLYLFGTSLSGGSTPPLVALFREVGIVLTPPANSFTLTAGEIDLLLSSSPVTARFADGTVTFAFQVRRGQTLSPMTLMDVDPSASGVQSPVLDTVAPLLSGLGTSGNVTGSFTSNLRDVTLIGRASEELRGVLVTTPLDDNVTTPGEIPPVSGAGAGGLFVADPVPLGLVDPAALPLSYTITVYDKALNASSPASGLFQQVGASGPGSALPGGNVAVDVFDAATLAPIAGAQVLTHQNDAGVVDPVASGTTDPNGHVSLAAAPSAGMETIVTVLATGYDIFTFDGVPTARLGVPLSRTAPIPPTNTTASGSVTTTSATLGTATKNVADSRGQEIGGGFFAVGACNVDPLDFSSSCPFGPSPIQAARIGAQAALAVIVPASPLQFSPATFLKAYQVSLPLPPVTAGGNSDNEIAFSGLLDDPTLDPTELPVDGAPATVLLSVNYPMLSAQLPAPLVRIEAKTPGIPGSLTVGQGIAYPETPPSLTWSVRAAYPGAVEPIDDPPAHTLGRLALKGTVEAPLMLRGEVTDSDGNTGGVRARLPFNSATLIPPAPPLLAVPPVVVNAGLLADDLMFADVLEDVRAEPGIYRVTLTDSAGRSWTIYRPDPPDSAGPIVIAHLPYTGVSNTIPLAPGPVECQISAYAWPGFDIAQFLWTDIEREHDLYAHAATATIPMLP